MYIQYPETHMLHAVIKVIYQNASASLIVKIFYWQTWFNLMTNLHQAGKIHNLQQVCDVSGCVHTQIAASLLQAFVVLQSSSRYQDALAPTLWCKLIVKTFYSQALMQVVSTTCSNFANIKLHQIWFSQTWCDSMEIGLIQIDDKLASEKNW